jgi:hypothetical protein
MDRYGGKGTTARAHWLQSFDGGYFCVDRIGRESDRIANYSVSVVGGIQPRRLAEFKGLTSDGLLQRFMPIMMRWCDDPPNSWFVSKRGAYQNLVYALADITPRDLTLSAEAELHMEEIGERRRELRRFHSDDSFKAFASKMRGVSGRLALIIALMEDQRATVVGVDIVERVEIMVFDFVLKHAECFYANVTRLAKGADYFQLVASWILTEKRARMVPSDLARYVNRKLFTGMTATEIGEVMSVLVGGGWVEPVQWGRHPPVSWIVNPRVHVEFAD